MGATPALRRTSEKRLALGMNERLALGVARHLSALGRPSLNHKQRPALRYVSLLTFLYLRAVSHRRCSRLILYERLALGMNAQNPGEYMFCLALRRLIYPRLGSI